MHTLDRLGGLDNPNGVADDRGSGAWHKLKWFPAEDVGAVLPAINPVIMDSRVFNPLAPPLDDSMTPLVRS